jgi:hypothetical protein
MTEKILNIVFEISWPLFIIAMFPYYREKPFALPLISVVFIQKNV